MSDPPVLHQKDLQWLLAALCWNHNTSASVAPSEQAAIFAQPSSERTVQMCLMWCTALCQESINKGPDFLLSVVFCFCVYLRHFCGVFSQSCPHSAPVKNAPACCGLHDPTRSLWITAVKNTPKRARLMPESPSVASRGRKHSSQKRVTAKLQPLYLDLVVRWDFLTLIPDTVFLTIIDQTCPDSTLGLVNVFRHIGKIK